MHEPEIIELSRLAYMNDDFAEQAAARGERDVAAFHTGRALAFRKSIRILKGAR